MCNYDWKNTNSTYSLKLDIQIQILNLDNSTSDFPLESLTFNPNKFHIKHHNTL